MPEQVRVRVDVQFGKSEVIGTTERSSPQDQVIRVQ